MMSTPAVASADVLRTMAHELRQPLSTIESIAYYLTLVLPPDEEKVHEQLNRIQELVEQSNWIVTSAQQLSEPISPAPQRIHIAELIAQLILERSVVADGPSIEVEGELPPLEADPALARAMIDNLLTLLRTVASDEHPLRLRLREKDGGVGIEIATEAPGYRSEASLGPGAILSLESARRIAAAHGGSLEVMLDPSAGIRVRVMLP